MAKLRKAVHVRDPDRHRTVLLLPGEEPEPRLAALITNPDAWDNGELPGTDGEDDKEPANPAGPAKADSPKAAPAAKKTAAKRAATKPARGRDAAAEGTSGD
jgi:hypothetical protein